MNATTSRRNLQKSTSDIEIDHSKFIINQAQLGGSLKIENFRILINNSEFIKNYALNGGAFHFSFTDMILDYQDLQPKLINTIFIDNSAQIAQIGRAMKIDPFVRNVSVNGRVDNIYYFIMRRYLNQNLNLYSSQQEKNSTIQIIDYESGTLNQEIFLQLATKNNQLFTDVQSDVDTVTAQISFLDDQHSTAKIEGNLSSQWNQERQGFLFNSLQLILNPYVNETLKLPIFDQDGYIEGYLQNYNLQVDVKMKKCQEGEELLEKTGICQKCQNVFYSLTSKDACLKCQKPQMEDCPGGNVIQVSEGYWRLNNKTDLIIYCLNYPDNCLGGNQNFTCKTGHIGGLCEACDLYGETGDVHHNLNQRVCNSCKNTDINLIRLVMMQIMIFGLTSISVISAVDSLTQTILLKLIFNMRMLKLGANIDQSNRLIIILVIRQIGDIVVGSILQFRINTPVDLEFVLDNFTNPTNSVGISVDCFLAAYGPQNFNVIYFRVVIFMIFPLILIMIILISYLIFLKIKNKRWSNSIQYTTIIYIFLFVQPSLTQQLIGLASFRDIGSIKYIQANVRYVYNSQEHITLLLSFIFPFLLLVAFVITFILFYIIHQKQNHLDDVRTKIRWGYLYHEYNSKVYFWEFIKIVQKILIIIILSFYQDYIVIKGILIYLIIYSYGILNHTFKPYQSISLNYLDNSSTRISSTIVLIAIFIYTSLQYLPYLAYIGYMLLFIFNTIFLSKMYPIFFYIFHRIRDLIKTFTPKIEDIINQTKLIFVRLFPFTKQLFQIQNQSQKTKYQKWSIVQTKIYYTIKDTKSRKNKKLLETQKQFNPIKKAQTLQPYYQQKHHFEIYPCSPIQEPEDFNPEDFNLIKSNISMDQIEQLQINEQFEQFRSDNIQNQKQVSNIINQEKDDDIPQQNQINDEDDQDEEEKDQFQIFSVGE